MKKTIFTLPFVGIMTLAGIVAIAPSTHAVEQEPYDIEAVTVSPATTKVTSTGGETVRGSYTVINTGDSEYKFTVYAQPYSVKGLEYKPDYNNEQAPRADAHRWIRFTTNSGQLEAGERQIVNYTVDVPDDVSPGGHYAILFTEVQPDDADSGVIQRKKRLGSVLRVNTDGEQRVQGEIIGSSFYPLQFSTPLKVSLDVENTGNVDFEIDSTFIVHDAFGNEKYRTTKDSVIYPDTTRRVPYEWDGVNWFGIYKVELSATYLNKDFNETRYVLVVPQWLIVLLIIGTAFGLYALFQRRR